MENTPSPSRGRLGWGWVSFGRRKLFEPIPTLTLPLKGREPECEAALFARMRTLLPLQGEEIKGGK